MGLLSGIVSTVKKVVTYDASKQLGQKVTGSAPVLASAVAPKGAAVVSVAKKAVSKVAGVVSTAFKTAPKTTIATGVLAYPTAQVLIGSEKARETVKSSVGGYLELGKDISKTIEGEQSIVDLAKEHPIAMSGAGLFLVSMIGKGVSPGAAYFVGSQLAKKSNESIVTNVPSSSPSVTVLPDSRTPETLPKEQPLSSGTSLPSPMASPSAAIEAAPVSTPVSIPKDKQVVTVAKKRKPRKKTPLSGSLRQQIKLRW